MLLQLLIVLLIVWMYKLRWNMRHYYRLAEQLKNDIPAWPIIGHAHKLIGDGENRMNLFMQMGREALKHGGLTSGWLVTRLFIVLLIVWMCKLRWNMRHYYRLAEQLRNDIPAWPIIGHAYKLIGDGEKRMRFILHMGRQALKHGGLTSFWLGTRLVFVIGDPTVAEYVLKNTLEKDDIVQMSKYVLGNGSIFAPVSIWRPRRKILVPTFSHKNLMHFVTIFAKQSTVMVEQLRSKAGAGPFQLWSFMTAYTMDSVCETAFGINLHAQKNPNQPFLEAFAAFLALMSKRVCQPWLHNDFIYKLHPDFKFLTKVKNDMSNFLNEIIKSKRNQLKEVHSGKVNLEPNIDSRNNIMELLIQLSGGDQGYSDRELEEELLVVLMAGIDTSAVGASFTALALSWYPEVQQKVYEELMTVFGNSRKLITPEDLPRLKYLEAVIKETLRLYPPVPLTVRKATTDMALPCGLTILKGCILLSLHWAIHRNKAFWGPDAEEFRPERFLDNQFKHPAQFVAFSYGSRNCVGYQYAMLSAKTALATLLLNYKILPASQFLSDRSGLGPESLRLEFDAMMKDVDHFTIALELRK